MPKIDEFLRFMLEQEASDCHLSAAYRPCLRVHGDIQPVEKWPVLTPEFNRELLYEIMPEHNRREFDERHDTDFAYEYEDRTRFRVNVFVDHNGIGAVLRQIPSRIPTVEDLNLPKAIRDFCLLGKGLVLITGPTGSGKSTTLAAVIDHINKTRSDHIITIEDPIEFVHRPQRCLINQREVHCHTRSFAAALRAALREDPDIVLVGEMRDLETMEVAIETAETGHLVFGTLHTNTAYSAVDRMIDKFPSDRQNQIRTMLADCLKGVVAQTLCRRKNGGRIAAFEILLVTPAVAGNIREGKTHQLPSAIQTGKNVGMQMLNEHLLRFVVEGVITPKEAYLRSVERDAMERKLRETGIPLEVDTERMPEIMDASAAVAERTDELRRMVGEYRAALQRDPNNLGLLNNLAWIYATSLDAGLRNGREAVKLAERANQLSKGADLHVLDTLGAAYAEAGLFKKAVETAERRLALATQSGQTDLLDGIKAHIRLYESGTALRHT